MPADRRRRADGKTVYEEGKDFDPVRDPKLGEVPYAGEYDFGHAGPALTLTDGSRIRDGQRLRVGWYHPVLTHGEQVMCCLSEPKVDELCATRPGASTTCSSRRPTSWRTTRSASPAGARRAATRKTPGELLAANARRCVGDLAGGGPEGARSSVWSDMFDPNHNAVDDYYLVNGTLAGSWEGLPRTS